MPVSSIAHVMLRSFSLSWIVTGLAQIAGAIATLPSAAPEIPLYLLAPGIGLFLAGFVFWFLSPWLSRIISRKGDGDFQLAGVSEPQLFATMFVGLGIYFAGSNLGSVFSWAHFFTIKRSPEYGFHRELAPSYYELAEVAITFVIGIYLVVTARIWARRLCKGESGKMIQNDTTASGA